MPDFYTLWTDQGLTKIGDATMDNPFNLTTAVVGDGNGNPVIPNKGQTALANQVWSGPVSSRTRSKADPNTIVFEFAIPATDGPFTIRDVGLKDADGTLCIVGNWPVTEKPVAVNGSTRDMVLRIPLHFENADVVNLSLDGNTALASAAALANHAALIVDPTRTGSEKKHLTDTQAKKWEDHLNNTNNPHNVTQSQIGYTASDVLSKLKTVHGSGCGLNADLLDGKHASAFSLSSHTHAEITAARILALLRTVDGSGCKLDADLLDGKHASDFSLSSHTHAEITAARILALLRTVDGSGCKLDADLLDGKHASSFLLAVNAFNGVASRIGTRTTNGTWTLTGLTVGKPLYLGVRDTDGGDGRYAAFRITSGANIARGTSNTNTFSMGQDAGRADANPGGISTIPTSTTVSIYFETINGVTVYAYQ